MIVALDNSGRLGNRLVYFAYTCATALISGQRYVNVMAGPVMEFAELDPSVMRVTHDEMARQILEWLDRFQRTLGPAERERTPEVLQDYRGRKLLVRSGCTAFVRRQTVSSRPIGRGPSACLETC